MRDESTKYPFIGIYCPNCEYISIFDAKGTKDAPRCANCYCLKGLQTVEHSLSPVQLRRWEDERDKYWGEVLTRATSHQIENWEKERVKFWEKDQEGLIE